MSRSACPEPGRRDRVLHRLRDHPWSGASQVAQLTGMPLRSVQRYLSALCPGARGPRELDDRGKVQAAQVPLVSGTLYAPAAAGVAALAGGRRRAKTYARAFHLDAFHLAGTLLRAHSLVWTRDFLGLLALWNKGPPLPRQDGTRYSTGRAGSPVGGTLQWAVSPWRARVGRRLLRLDGIGAVSWMGRCIRFAVLADPGGLAVEGYKRVFERFARWARGDEFADARPALVVLTTYGRRARQLSVLWKDTTGKQTDEAPLEMFVGVFGEVTRDPAAWRRGGTAGQGPLWRGCRGSRVAISRPWPSLAPPSGARPVRVEDLDEWMGRGNDGRRRQLRAFLALSGKAWRVLGWVARWPLLRSTDLALLGGYSRDGVGTVAKALDDLKELELVEVVREADARRRGLELRRAQLEGRLAEATEDELRARLTRRLLGVEDELLTVPSTGGSTGAVLSLSKGSPRRSGHRPESGGPKRYVLSHRGLALLAATRGMPPLAYGRARLWPVGYVEVEGKRVVELRTARYLLAWEHTLLTVEFFLGLRRLAEKQWDEMSRNHELLIWDSVECRRRFWDEEGRQLLLPDSGGVYRIGEEEYEFWLEIDRGDSVAGKHGQALRRKYERYYLYRRRPDALYGRRMPRVLVVTPQIGRARQVRRVVVELAEDMGERPLPVYVTTLDDVWLEGKRGLDGRLHPRRGGSDGPGRPARKRMWPGLRVWRRVDEFHRLVWCFEGLGHMPPGTQRGVDLTALGREVRAHSRRSRAQQKRRSREA